MFSEKYGYKTAKQIQHECISDVLRRRIWNLFYQWEIQDGGLSSVRLSQAINGKQSFNERTVFANEKVGRVLKNANRVVETT